MVQDKTFASRLFDISIYVLLTIVALLVFLPFLNIVMSSFATAEEMARRPFILIPEKFTLISYRYVLSTGAVFRAMAVSIGVTVVGTFISMLLTSLMAYGLTRKDLDGRKIINFLVVFTMLFSGGLIPTFLVVKNLGLIDSYWSLILPVAVSAFNMVIMRSFFQNLPDGIEESARMDGCSDIGTFFRIVLPLSMAVVATISLFYAVNYWNAWTGAILYLNDSNKWPLQLLLRQIVLVASGFNGDNSGFGSDFVQPPEQTVKMAVIVISTVPILLVYPFLQKYFAKGALVGSVKG
jgi:putative aldouronate transport system permease protein